MKISKLNVIHLNTESSSSNVQIIRFDCYHNVIFPNLRSFLFLYCQDKSRVIFVTMQQSEIKHIIHQWTIVYFHNIFMTVFLTVNNRKSNSELEFQGCSHAAMQRAFGFLRLRNFKHVTCYVSILPTACTNASSCAHRPPIEKIVTKQGIEGVMFVMLYDISRNWKKKNIIFPKSTGLPDLYQQHTQKQVLDIIREIYIDGNSNWN